MLSWWTTTLTISFLCSMAFDLYVFVSRNKSKFVQLLWLLCRINILHTWVRKMQPWEGTLIQYTAWLLVAFRVHGPLLFSPSSISSTWSPALLSKQYPEHFKHYCDYLMLLLQVIRQYCDNLMLLPQVIRQYDVGPSQTCNQTANIRP